LFLGKALRTKGHVVINVSESGADTQITLNRFPHVVPKEKPDIVIIALSLSNEGLHYSEDACVTFETNIKKLIEMVKEISAIPILGGLYPNNMYTQRHYELVKKMQGEMMTWGCPVIDFLRTTDNGNVHWKQGIFSDAGHPNDKGHQLMYQAIDLRIFDQSTGKI